MNGYMGIDIGTSGCKAAVFDENGSEISLSYREYDIISPQKGWAELDSDHVIEKCFEVIKESVELSSFAKIVGIGISSQGEAFTPIDENGKSLYNAIVSSDMRAVHYVNSWPEKFGSDKLYKITGHTSHSLFSLFKLLWLKDNEPEIFNKAHKFLCFEDLLQYRLGLEPSMGYPMAGRTMLFDITNHCWSEKILQSIGLSASKLATPLPSGSLAGNVSEQVAENLCLCSKTFIVTGGHDQPCSALGAGAIEPGTAVYSTGTVECITPAFSKPVFSTKLKGNNLCTYDHVVKDTYATVAYSLTGGNLLKWYRDEFGNQEIAEAKKRGTNPYELILKQVEDKPTDLLVLPYFTATGTPYFDTEVKGMIYGLSLSTKRSDLLRALLEGVTMEMKLNLNILEESGCPVTSLRIIGGGAKSDVLTQLKADVLGVPISIVQVNEAGCMGMAMLAYSLDKKISLQEIVANWVKIQDTKFPRDDFAKLYNAKFIEYQRLYPMIKQNISK